MMESNYYYLSCGLINQHRLLANKHSGTEILTRRKRKIRLKMKRNGEVESQTEPSEYSFIGKVKYMLI